MANSNNYRASSPERTIIYPKFTLAQKSSLSREKARLISKPGINRREHTRIQEIEAEWYRFVWQTPRRSIWNVHLFGIPTHLPKEFNQNQPYATCMMSSKTGSYLRMNSASISWSNILQPRLLTRGWEEGEAEIGALNNCRAVSPRGTGVTPLQPPSPLTGLWFIPLFRFLFFVSLFRILARLGPFRCLV